MALTAPRALNIRGLEQGRYYDTLINAAAVVFKHGLVGINATGFVVNQADSTAIQPGGLATRFIGGTATAAGGYTGDGSTVWCRYYTDIEVFFPTAAHAVTVVATMVRNTQLYCTDDEIVTNVATLGSSIGVMTEFTSTGIWVQIGGVVRPMSS